MMNTLLIGQTITGIQLFSPLVSGLFLSTRPVNIFKSEGGVSDLSRTVQAFKWLAYSTMASVTLVMIMAFDIADSRPKWAIKAFPLDLEKPETYY
jgi:hypothetical protein